MIKNNMEKFSILNKIDQKFFFIADLHFGDDLIFKNLKEYELKIMILKCRNFQ